MLSVLRTFMRDVDDIRITLQHLSELDLIAARRVHGALRASGASDVEARRLIARVARVSWRELRN